ncbi:uncharacterized protein EI90DRAFT_2914698 [Cantharellus anzutake]|uniref:uncharacterized protein n=1 Tax=Cantharellus anzutake TaxID=1750568 RepID=UPI001903BA1B|nr:uncharacterized protein EI90DRAFT_2914698 [Cantharellus anzutake]KAF8334688.1 hypothetical protein EI90DRAFT_2914698 [Cantharellus anzutake]
MYSVGSGVSDPTEAPKELSITTPNPILAHTLRQEESSVLSLAADVHHIFSGSQGKDIYVWDRQTFQIKTTLKGHEGSVLMLEVSEEKGWLFSSSSDSTIRVWDTSALSLIYTIHPHGETEAGDIFSLAYSPPHSSMDSDDAPGLNTLFFGCQNTSLQWLDLSRPNDCLALEDMDASDLSMVGDGSGAVTPEVIPMGLGISVASPSGLRKLHKFFDSQPRGASNSALGSVRTPSSAISQLPSSAENFTLQVPPQNVIESAHFGYVYCMALVPWGCSSSSRNGGSESEIDSHSISQCLVTGSGNADVKVLTSLGPPKLQHTFTTPCGGSGGAVLSILIRNGCLFAGCQDGLVHIWDFEMKSLVRSIPVAAESIDVLSLSMLDDDLYTCLSNGKSRSRWSRSFACSAIWKAHDGIVLSSIVARISQTDSSDPESPPQTGQQYSLITGASDNHIKLWTISGPRQASKAHVVRPQVQARHFPLPPTDSYPTSLESLVFSLTDFVAIPSVTNSEPHREFCRQAARWLQKTFAELGADAVLVPSAVPGRNPLVLGTFSANGTKTAPNVNKRYRVLVYGHYDVVAASSQSSWLNPPFELTGLNGYLYGRGASDNKGPLLASAWAVAGLQSNGELDMDVVFLVEGEEEAGSGGFAESDVIGPIDAILVSNSYWIDDETPCITYGLRGVIHASIEISNQGEDRHSGVDGGARPEPMMDMVKLLGTLMDANGTILLPSFYDCVRPAMVDEEASYVHLAKLTGSSPHSISSKWREPSLTIHSVTTSGSSHSTVIPSSVRAQVSLRIVPDQSLADIIAGLELYLRSNFERLRSPNSIKIEIERTADWWLGRLDDRWFRALEKAVQDEWGVRPLRIREGGSIPSVPYLEKEFKCHALHLPMGQSSDRAHLKDERMSLNNLYKGRSVVEHFFRCVSSDDCFDNHNL